MTTKISQLETDLELTKKSVTDKIDKNTQT